MHQLTKNVTRFDPRPVVDVGWGRGGVVGGGVGWSWRWVVCLVVVVGVVGVAVPVSAVESPAAERFVQIDGAGLVGSEGVAGGGDVTGDGVADLVVTVSEEPVDTRFGVPVGVAVVPGGGRARSWRVSWRAVASRVIRPGPGDVELTDVGIVPDVNGDGVGEVVVVQKPRNPVTEPDAQTRVFVVYGAASGDVRVSELAAEQGFEAVAAVRGLGARSVGALDVLGDVDGAGSPGLVVKAYPQDERNRISLAP